MGSNPPKSVVILGILCFVVALAAFHLGMSRAELRQRNAELDKRVTELQQAVDDAKTREKSLQDQLAQRSEDLNQQAKSATDLKTQLNTILHPPQDNPGCIDSDADHGQDQIFYRGSVRTGNAVVSDRCQLGQLVEYSCIESPPGSGQRLVDYRIADCPPPSRCVEGACVR
jgi:TolA-binding protein